MSAAVRVSGYIPGEAPIQNPAPIGVLQLKLGDTWLLEPNGQDVVAVLLGQLFRIWLGFDRSRINKAQLEGMLGSRLGKIILLVNEESIEIPL